MKSHIIDPITIEVNARNHIAVDRDGCDRSKRNHRIDRTNWCTFIVKNGKVDRQQVSIGQGIGLLGATKLMARLMCKNDLHNGKQV